MRRQFIANPNWRFSSRHDTITMMGTFLSNGDGTEDEPMMMSDEYEGVSSLGRSSTSSCFERSNSLGNDFCPHSSQLFPLMEADDELPVQTSSLRKQTAVTCLSALVETPDYESGSNGSQEDLTHIHAGGGVFPVLSPDQSPDDEWGHFAQHATDLYRSSSRVRLPSRRRRPHQRRRSPAKYDRRGSPLASVWSG